MLDTLEAIVESDSAAELADKLQDKLDELLAQRVALLREYRPASRPVRDLDEQISALQAQLNASREIRTPNPVRAQLRAPNR